MSTSLTKRVGAALAAGAVGAVAFAASGSLSAQTEPTIAVTEVDLVADTIEITNVGDADVDVNGLILCNFPAYAPIEGAATIAPGESIVVDSGALGVELADDQGEMGIYTVADYENPDAILTYVEWGTADHQRSPVAVQAGIWDGGVVEAGERLVSNVDEPTAASNWSTEGGESTTDGTAILAETGADTVPLLLLGAALLVLAAVSGAGSVLVRRRAGA